jgi:cyclopropane-fatty-acyl-phospholipid synthase
MISHQASAESLTITSNRGASNVARVLDIGCGWGAMLRRLVDQAGVANAVGLTLSPSQARWIRDHPRSGLSVVEQNWRDHKPDQRYDAIVSIGAFEHFVQKGLDPARKLDAYREFFAF